MSEYRVAFTEVPGECQDNETYGGVLIHIRPPVQLNPDAVERYLTYSDFEPIDPADRKLANLEVKDVVVLGNTAVQTTIYASIDKTYERRLAEQAANNTARLLRFMGAQAIIDHPLTPDT
jgi:hypothetical protein